MVRRDRREASYVVLDESGNVLARRSILNVSNPISKPMRTIFRIDR